LLLRGGNGGRPGGAVIFTSNFSTAADGWQVLQNTFDGQLGNGSYYISATSSGNTEISVPMNASGLFPVAPPSIRVDVAARGIRGPGQDIQYGIVCRENNGDAYFFEIQGNKATIAKMTDNGAIFAPLASGTVSGVRAGTANQLSAVCTDVAGQQAVHLAFWVNGAQLLSVTDRNSPLGDGTVGLFTSLYGISVPGGVEAQFSDFEVRQL
jgi:hypothetical protein